MRAVFLLLVLSDLSHYVALGTSAPLEAGARKITPQDGQDFVKAAMDGIDLGMKMLNVMTWSAMQAMTLMNSGVELVGHFMSWFTFFVNLVKPGGMVDDLAAFVRAGKINITVG